MFSDLLFVQIFASFWNAFSESIAPLDLYWVRFFVLLQKLHAFLMLVK